MSILIFLIILVLLIIVHEFGHFIVAKKSGVRVDEFGIGFPPKLYGKKFGETEYTLNAIPLGGFVKIFGESPDPESLEGPDKDRSMVNKPKYIQAMILLAGVFFNIIFAWFLISIGFMVGLPASAESLPAGATLQDEMLTVIGVENDSPADVLGLKLGDRIVSLTQGEDELFAPTPASIITFIDTAGEAELSLTYRRGSVTESILITPTEGIVEGRVAIGISMEMVGIATLPPHRAIWEGGKMTIGLTGAVAGAFVGLVAGLFGGGSNIVQDLIGPVGIVGIVGQAADFGFIYLLTLTAIISINLAIINLIPFPALDGGRLLFLGIEAVKGSPIKPETANVAHTLGFVILIVLMIFVTYNDVVRLFVG